MTVHHYHHQIDNYILDHQIIVDLGTCATDHDIDQAR